MDIFNINLFGILHIASLVQLGYSADFPLVNQQCYVYDEGEKCLFLYGSSQIITEVEIWQEAYDACQGIGLQLAIPEETFIMEQLASLTSNIKNGYGSVHAWIGGRKRHNETWIYIDDTLFPEIVAQGCPLVDPFPNDCAMLDEDGNITSCDCRNEPRNQIMPLCQYAGSCQDSQPGFVEVEFGGNCYVVPSGDAMNWFQASTFCSRLQNGAKLATEHLSSRDLMGQLYSKLNISDYLWVGVLKNPWVWVKGETEEIILESNWLGGQGHDAEANGTEYCMHVEPNENGTWSDKPCDLPAYYFICQNETKKSTTPTTITTTTISTTTTTTPTTTTRSTATSTSTIASTTTRRTTTTTTIPTTISSTTRTTPTITPAGTAEPQTQDDEGFNLLYLIAIFAGLLVIIVIIIACCCAAKKRKKKKSESGFYQVTLDPDMIGSGYKSPRELDTEELIRNYNSVPTNTDFIGPFMKFGGPGPLSSEDLTDEVAFYGPISTADSFIAVPVNSTVPMVVETGSKRNMDDNTSDTSSVKEGIRPGDLI